MPPFGGIASCLLLIRRGDLHLLRKSHALVPINCSAYQKIWLTPERLHASRTPRISYRLRTMSPTVSIFHGPCLPRSSSSAVCLPRSLSSPVSVFLLQHLRQSHHPDHASPGAPLIGLGLMARPPRF